MAKRLKIDPVYLSSASPGMLVAVGMGGEHHLGAPGCGDGGTDTALETGPDDWVRNQPAPVRANKREGVLMRRQLSPWDSQWLYLLKDLPVCECSL